MGLQQDIRDRWQDAVRLSTQHEQTMAPREVGRSADEISDLVHPLLAALEESVEQLAYAIDELRSRSPSTR